MFEEPLLIAAVSIAVWELGKWILHREFDRSRPTKRFPYEPPTLIPVNNEAKEARIRELEAALDKSLELIRYWHGSERPGLPDMRKSWTEYCLHDREMKSIIDVLPSRNRGGDHVQSR